MAVALGGRIAEELIFGEDDITTGASGDFQQVTRTARLMVTQLGFSKKLGQVCHVTMHDRSEQRHTHSGWDRQGKGSC